jgi:hypothetical protein
MFQTEHYAAIRSRGQTASHRFGLYAIEIDSALLAGKA